MFRFRYWCLQQVIFVPSTRLARVNSKHGSSLIKGTVVLFALAVPSVCIFLLGQKPERKLLPDLCSVNISCDVPSHIRMKLSGCHPARTSQTLPEIYAQHVKVVGEKKCLLKCHLLWSESVVLLPTNAKCQAVAAADETSTDALKAGRTSETQRWATSAWLEQKNWLLMDRNAPNVQSCSRDPFLGNILWELEERSNYVVSIIWRLTLFSEQKKPK